MIEDTNALFRRKLFVESEKILRFIYEEVEDVDDIELFRIFMASVLLLAILILLFMMLESTIETTFLVVGIAPIDGKTVLVYAS